MSDKEKILIADDSAMNRAILTEMLGDGYEILEAENGRQAVAILQSATDIDLLLLDIMMPEMDGFEVLAMMNKYHWIDEVPVIMISAENASSYVERAYDLGATDYISRPFDMAVVRRRVINTLMLYAKQKRLVRLVAEQVYEKEKSNSTMINILSHIVEFRNGDLYINGQRQTEPYVHYICDWNLPPRTVEPGHYYVVGDNRSQPIEQHKFGQVLAGKIAGAPLF